MREDDLKIAIREGELRLLVEKNAGKRHALEVAVDNSRVRLERLQAGLSEGRMIFNGTKWVYEFSKIEPLSASAETRY